MRILSFTILFRNILLPALVVLLLGPALGFGQHAEVVSVRHWITSMLNGIGNTPAIAYDGITGLCMTGEEGVLRTTDMFRTFDAVFPPEVAAYFLQYYGCASVHQGYFIAGGSTKLQDNTYKTLVSHDGGLHWEQHPTLTTQGFGPRSPYLFPDGKHGRLGWSFTRDSGHTFFDAQFDFPLHELDIGDFHYAGDGRFLYRHRNQRQWYDLDWDSERFVPTDAVPASIHKVYRTSDSTVIGLGSKLYVQKNNSPEYQRLTLYDEDGNPVEKYSLETTYHLDGGSLFLFVHLSGMFYRCAVIVGDRAQLLPEDFAGAGMLSVDVPHSSHHNTVALTAYDPYDTRNNKVVVLNTETRSVRDVPVRSLSMPRFDLQTDSLLLYFDNKRAIASVNIFTGETELLGTINDPYGRAVAIPVDKGVLVNGRLVFAESTGNVFELDSSNRSLLLRNNLVARKLSRQTDVSSLLSGTNRLWSDSAGVVAGGEALHRVTADGRIIQERADSTSAWVHTSWGDELAGHHGLSIRRAGSDDYEPLPVPWDTTAIIGTLAESNGVLVAGLRGMYREKDLEPDGTVAGGLWLSADQGTTWTQSTLPGNPPMVLSVSVRRSDASLWVTAADVTVHIDTEPGADGVDRTTAEMSNLRLLYSRDQGNTWREVASAPRKTGWRDNISNATFFGEQTIAWAAFDQVLWSDDAGQTWREVSGLPAGKTAVSHVMFDAHGNLYISTNQGIYTVAAQPSGVEAAEDGGRIFWAESYPNPGGSTITLRLHNTGLLQGEAEVLKIIDIMGRTVADLRSRTRGLPASESIDVPLQLGDLPCGMYLLVSGSGGAVTTRPLQVQE